MTTTTPDLKDRTFKNSREHYEEVTDFLLEEKTQKMTLDEVEHIVKTKGRDLQRSLLEEHIASRGTGDLGSSLKGTDGVERTHKKISERKILTIFGEVKISRVGYFKLGLTSCFFPLDEKLNLPDCSYSYLLQKLIVLEAIKGSFDEVVESIYRTTETKISKGKSLKIIFSDSERLLNY